MRRIHTAAAVAGAAALILTAACSDSSTATGDGDGDGWSIPEEDPTATIQVLGHQDAELMEPVIEVFHEDHPDITVEYEAVPFDQLNSVLDARIANQDGNPDVYWADQPRVAALASRGYLEDLTEQFADLTGTFDSAPVESSSFDGSLWSLPIANSTQLLYYNADLLDEAGVEAPSGEISERITWEEIRDRAQQAVDGGAEHGFLFGQVHRYYQIQPLPQSKGGSAGASDDLGLEPDITSEPWVESMEFYQSLFTEDLSPLGVTPEQSSAEFITGNTAFFVQGPWLLPQLEEAEFTWGVAPHPYFEGGEPVTPTGSWSLGMSPFSDDKEAAAIFMRWMSTDNGGGYAVNFGAPELPSTPEGKEDYFQRDVFDSDAGQDAVTIIDHETAETGVPRLQTVGFVEFEEILGRAFSDIASGTDPETALQSAQDELTTAWAQYE